jgi:GNAT superfamily N-acetyltransferase
VHRISNIWRGTDDQYSPSDTSLTSGMSPAHLFADRADFPGLILHSSYASSVCYGPGSRTDDQVFSSPEAKEPIATIMCKQEPHRTANRGYIGMLSVDKAWRRRGIGTSPFHSGLGRCRPAADEDVASKLANLAIKEMASRGATEVSPPAPREDVWLINRLR